MTAILSAAERAEFVALAREMLLDSYTRLPRIATSNRDDWNGVLVVDDTGHTTTSVPCQFQPAKTGRRDETGKGIDDRPALLVDLADPLAAGDLVSNARDADGRVLLAGPAIVAAVEPFVPGGVFVLYRASLEVFTATHGAEIGASGAVAAPPSLPTLYMVSPGFWSEDT